jgi:2-methylisocitrate lyase-like PEP mutase family enzyme
MHSDFAAARAAFQQLHQSGCFVIPNPWDIGSAKYLRHLGFPALATTSSGFAFSRGLPDDANTVGRDAVVAHVAEIAGATELPVNADFQDGYGATPEEVAESVRRCVEAGASGLSIEDSDGVGLYDLPVALERLRAARAAIDATRSGVLLTARAECFLRGHADPLRESIRRLQAFAAAGADVLYAPGPRTREDIRAIVSAVAPKPVNVLMGWNTGLTVADIAELGARRISVGSSLARAAWTGFINAATLIAKEGSFAGFDGLVGGKDLNEFFQAGLESSRSQGRA